jgi:hypothetical protein
VTPSSIGGGVPCATFSLFDAITMNPCVAKRVSKKLYVDGIVPVPLPHVMTGNKGPPVVKSEGPYNV